MTQEQTLQKDYHKEVSSSALMHINCQLAISSAKSPNYATINSSGADLYANLPPSVELFLKPGEFHLVPVGVMMAIPETHTGLIMPRSGLAAKHGITVLNSPGVVDPDYRGEIKVCLINLGKEVFQIKNGMRIAQILFIPCSRAKFLEVDSFDTTERGCNGFGSTGY